MRSSFALLCLYRETVVISTSSSGWPRTFSFMFFKTRSTSCYSRICAFALIPFMDYDVVFPTVFLNYFTLDFKESGYSFAAHCFALCRDCCFRSNVCSSDSSLSSACVKKTCSSLATSEEDVVTSLGIVWIYYLILRRIFSVTSTSSLERKSVLTEPAVRTILKLNRNT